MEQALGSRYVIGERLGGGGMGTVYRAKRRDGGPDRAVKLLRPELAEDPVVLTRFVQERTLMLAMRNEHLVAVEDMIVDGDTVAIVMELVRGGTLRKYAAEAGPMAAPTALRLTRQVLEGLDIVHANGVVHRDVKPENVLLDRPEGSTDVVVKVSDFGIARLVDSPRLTGTFNYIGTPHYCAPEIANGASATPAVDVFAAGVMLYELVAGSTPFAGLAPYAVIKRQMEHATPQSPLIPQAVWSVLARWLSADPAARPPDARQAMLEVDDLLKMMSSPTISLPGAVVPAQAEPLASQPGQAPLRAAGLAAAGAGGSALAGPPQAPGLAPPVAPDHLEVIHTAPPAPPGPALGQEQWPRHWPSQEGYDGTPPFGLAADHPSIVPGFDPTPPPIGGHTPPPQATAPLATPTPAPGWNVDTGQHKIRRSKGLVVGAVAVVVVAGAVGAVVAVASGGASSKSSLTTTPSGAAATLTFPTETIPNLGVTENRTWSVSGGAHPALHGTLVFHTTRNVLARVNELLPKSLVSDVSKITFKPQPKVIQADPVVQYTLPTTAGQTVTETYDIPISADDVSMSAMQRWAAEQIAQTGAAYREAHKPTSMSIAPKDVTLPVGSHLQLQLNGKLADGSAAPSVAFGGAMFTIADPAVATVSNLGMVTGVAQGKTYLVAKLGTLTAAVPVTVTKTSVTRSAQDSLSAAPTSDQPSSDVPTSEAPTSDVPTSAPPTSDVPTTVPPTSDVPTTVPPTSDVPTTAPPTSDAPTSEPPTSLPATAAISPAAPAGP